MQYQYYMYVYLQTHEVQLSDFNYYKENSNESKHVQLHATIDTKTQ